MEPRLQNYFKDEGVRRRLQKRKCTIKERAFFLNYENESRRRADADDVVGECGYLQRSSARELDRRILELKVKISADDSSRRRDLTRRQT